MILGTAVSKRQLINVACPRCGTRPMELKPACCGDRRRGIKAIRKCRKCKYKVAIR